MKKINISNIDHSLDYQGYLWLSDKKEPIILIDEKIPDNIFNSLPFVVEGYLFCKSKYGLSIKIKNVDGEYHVSKVELNTIPKDQITQNDFVAIKNDKGIKKILSVQYWEKVPDQLSENMDTLEPSWVAFNGFM